jgi:hypothetical protein
MIGRVRWTDCYGWRWPLFTAFWGGIAVALAVGIVALVFVISDYEKGVARRRCEQAGENWVQEVRFADYGRFDHECLIRSNSGKWVQLDRFSSTILELEREGYLFPGGGER